MAKIECFRRSLRSITSGSNTRVTKYLQVFLPNSPNIPSSSSHRRRRSGKRRSSVPLMPTLVISWPSPGGIQKGTVHRIHKSWSFRQIVSNLTELHRLEEHVSNVRKTLMVQSMSHQIPGWQLTQLMQLMHWMSRRCKRLPKKSRRAFSLWHGSGGWGRKTTLTKPRRRNVTNMSMNKLFEIWTKWLAASPFRCFCKYHI